MENIIQERGEEFKVVCVGAGGGVGGRPGKEGGSR
jgi:hypothetical protein